MATATPQPVDDVRHHQQGPPAPKVPDGRPPPISRLFPLGYKDGWSQWWASIPSATAEHRVLSFIPYLQRPPTHLQTGKVGQTPSETTESLESADHSQPSEVAANSSVNDPHGPRVWKSTMVELSGKDRALNEFSVERVEDKTEPHSNLVILHGYGAGLGFFYKNYEALSRAKGWQLYALDLLGMGRSTRPPFKIEAKEQQKAISETEDWFIDALEEWRIKRKIERFTLLGHSLGGYLAVCYALKYPGRLSKLILASPVGIPEDPRIHDASDSTVANEFTQDQSDVVQSSNGSQRIPGNNGNVSNTAPNAASTNKVTNNNNQPPRKPIPKWLKYLWDANVSPFSFVRWTGPFGPRLVSGWTSRRFSHLPQDEADALHSYAYSLFRLTGSGEFALAHLLAPGAFARSPLIHRIQGVGRQILKEPVESESSPVLSSTENISSSTSEGPQTPASSSSSAAGASFSTATSQLRRETGIPIVFIYGSHDWMSFAGGEAAKAKIEEERERVLKDATPEERQADRGSAKVIVVNGAGHHIYIDRWREFNEVISKEMELSEGQKDSSVD